MKFIEEYRNPAAAHALAAGIAGGAEVADVATVPIRVDAHARVATRDGEEQRSDREGVEKFHFVPPADFMPGSGMEKTNMSTPPATAAPPRP